MVKPQCVFFRASLFVFALLCISSFQIISSEPSLASTVTPRISLQPEKAVNGSLVLLEVRVDENVSGPGAPVAFVEGVSVPVFEIEKLNETSQKKYGALFGVPYHQEPGTMRVKVELPGSNQKTSWSEEKELVVTLGDYASEKLTVNPRHVTPKQKDLARIKRESAEIAKIYTQVTPFKMWNRAFELPVKSDTTSQFGTRRVYNGELRSFHSGLDLKAGVGRRIRAPEDGKVALSKSLFYTGNTVILDHGYGVYTVYAHLSQLRVKVGQKVSRGTLLGLAGSTGRVNGPHLHWGAVVHGVKVNPEDLTRLMP